MTRNGHLPHILAIDETEDLLHLYMELLEDAGYQVTTQAAERPSPEAIARYMPDLLLLGTTWESGEDALAYLTPLKASPLTSHLPIVLCTATARQMASIAEQLTALQIVMLSKPFDIDVLVRAVSHALADGTLESAR